jgi:hypothetical protein
MGLVAVDAEHVADLGERLQVAADPAAQVEDIPDEAGEARGTVARNGFRRRLLQAGAGQQQPRRVGELRRRPDSQRRLLAGRRDQVDRPGTSEPLGDGEVIR